MHIARMRPILFASLALSLLALPARPAQAQAIEAARGRYTSLQAGGMFSVFQPDFDRNWPPSSRFPVAGASSQPMLCIGTYVDLDLYRWFGIEAEGRWGRYNKDKQITESNYLIGAKIPLTQYKRLNVYSKALIGYANMDLGIYGATGSFTDLAFGGGADIRLTRHVNFRALDFEYQYWPQWGDSTLKPYGLSSGFAYRFF